MKTNNILLIAVLALAFYWLYQNGKRKTAEVTATAAGTAATNPVPEPKNTSAAAPPAQVIRLSAPKKGTQVQRTNALANMNFTLTTKTPFSYEN